MKQVTSIMSKRSKGSVLVFSLLVLSVLLVGALTTASVAVFNKQISGATGKSTLAFQVADGAAEAVIQRIYKDTDATLSDLADNLPGDARCGGGSDCPSGTVCGTLPRASAGTLYKVTFLDNDGNKLQCSGAGFATYAEWRGKLVRINAEGTYARTKRAIQLGIRP